MEKIEYPKWKYAATGAVLVQDAAEEAALGDGYEDSPADVQPVPVIDPRDAEIEALKAELAAQKPKRRAAADTASEYAHFS